jgi:HEAT repeat protein
MQCLANLREEKAIPRLRELALAQDSPALVRIESARALGVIRRSGGEIDADTLSADATGIGLERRIAAASLLRHHDSPDAVRRLQHYASSQDATVATIALARLVEIDPKLVVPQLISVLGSPDANVRGFGVEVLFRQPSETHIRLLGERMGDHHPHVRVQARKHAHSLAQKPEWKVAVIATGETALASGDWRAKEQGALLLGLLRHTPAAPRLVELLNDPRGEVAVATGWALRVLAVPETLPKVLDYVQKNTVKGDIVARRKIPADALDRQLSQLCQFLAFARHMPAEPIFRSMIPPRMEPIPEARAAACWALGHFHEGNTIDMIATLMIDRVTAVRPGDVEDPRVRRMCAVSLARMNAQSAVPALRRFCPIQQPSTDIVNNAFGWAIEKLTGEKMAPIVPLEVPQRAWFLSPLDR